jgi:dTMP kinase
VAPAPLPFASPASAKAEQHKEATNVRGLFITFEGPDGCGKTTQIKRLVAALEAAGREVVCTRDPGGTAISEQVRAVVLNPANTEMCDDCELLLYEAARAQLTRQIIEPALVRGQVVICDRYIDSTTAYQAGGRGIPEDRVARANALGSCGIRPDATLVLDLSVEEAFARAGRVEDGGPDRLESAGLALQQRVRDAYLRLADSEPWRVRVVDASGDPEAVHLRVAGALADVLPELEQSIAALDGASGEVEPEESASDVR